MRRLNRGSDCDLQWLGEETGHYRFAECLAAVRLGGGQLDYGLTGGQDSRARGQ